MIAYCYNSENIFTGMEEAQESPLQPGVFLLPAQATFEPIPYFNSQTERLVWDEEKEEWVKQSLPEKIADDIDEMSTHNVISPEQETVLITSIMEKLKNIGLTDEELLLIFGDH